MPTLVLSPRFNEDSQALWSAALKLGWDVHRAIRYQANGVEDPFVYGELPFCDVMASRLGLGLLDPPDDWLANLPFKYVQRTVRFMKHRDLSKVTERAFIKPANDKMFEAKVYERGPDVPHRFIDPACPVLVSDVVDFHTEVRCYILDRKVKTLSLYKMPYSTFTTMTQEAVHLGARDFAQQVLDDFDINMPTAMILDVGIIEGKGWAVVEANQAYSAGIYEHADPKAVLSVLARASGRLDRVLPGDRDFIRCI